VRVLGQAGPGLAGQVLQDVHGRGVLGPRGREEDEDQGAGGLSRTGWRRGRLEEEGPELFPAELPVVVRVHALEELLQAVARAVLLPDVVGQAQVRRKVGIRAAGLDELDRSC